MFIPGVAIDSLVVLSFVAIDSVMLIETMVDFNFATSLWYRSFCYRDLVHGTCTTSVGQVVPN